MRTIFGNVKLEPAPPAPPPSMMSKPTRDVKTGGSTTFRVFSGWDARQAEAAEVFAYSVRENASIDVDLAFISADRQVPGLNAYCSGRRRGLTAFTYSRFHVPAACGYEGRALFADGCDMLCLGDVRELAEWDMRGKPLWVVKHPSPGRRLRSWVSLMLMDCEALSMSGWTSERAEHSVDAQLMLLRDFSDDQIGGLPQEWNALVDPDVEHPGGAVATPLEHEPKMLHWSYLSNPDGGSWIDRSGSLLWAEWRDRWRKTT